MEEFAEAVKASGAMSFPAALAPEAVEASSMSLADAAFDLLLSGLPVDEKLAFLQALFRLFEQVMGHSESKWVRERFWDLVTGKVAGMQDELVEAALVGYLSRLLVWPDIAVQYGALVGLSNLKTGTSMGVAREFGERAEDSEMRQKALLAGRGELA